ncbi:hypothetical protein E2C01_076644 [Portunus trituberculatus]|uniref:Uncharacterized protein n=1 Tax=Portunus trituberculatus TaxID=210409 RepID=A0A5B7IDQ6_PORTR|nr:hypothetical protein [Portunus trituberculatus]
MGAFPRWQPTGELNVNPVSSFRVAHVGEVLRVLSPASLAQLRMWGTAMKTGVRSLGYACILSCRETRRGEMANDLVNSADENVIATSTSQAVSPVSEDVVAVSIRGAASSVPDRLDLFMQ